MDSILVIGGTGKVGSRLVQVLRARGHDVRVASRTSGDVHFDWHDVATHRPAVGGLDAVFVVGPGSATDWTGLSAPFLERAKAQGVRRVVLLSARGVEFRPGGVVARAEEAIRRGPLAWTILRPSHFAQNFTEAMFVPVDGLVAAPVGDGAEPFIDAQDIAEVAAAILTRGAHVEETIDLSGPAALTFQEAVQILAAHAGRSLQFVAEDPEVHAAWLRAGGAPEEYVTWRMAMLDGIRAGRDAYLSDGVQRVLGRPATSFDAWAAREAGVSTPSVVSVLKLGPKAPASYQRSQYDVPVTPPALLVPGSGDKPHTLERIDNGTC